MIYENDDDVAGDLNASLPEMRERARDHIHLMFLIDDFERALSLNMEVVDGTVTRFSGKLSDDLKANLEPKLTADLLMVLEMACNLRTRGKGSHFGAVSHLILNHKRNMRRVPIGAGWDPCKIPILLCKSISCVRFAWGATSAPIYTANCAFQSRAAHPLSAKRRKKLPQSIRWGSLWGRTVNAPFF